MTDLTKLTAGELLNWTCLPGPEWKAEIRRRLELLEKYKAALAWDVQLQAPMMPHPIGGCPECAVESTFSPNLSPKSPEKEGQDV